jgi:hypothetical protein
MLLLVFFDKMCLSKLKLVITKNKTLMKQIQSSQKSKGKSIPAYGFLKSQEKNLQTESLETFAQIFVITNNKNP